MILYTAVAMLTVFLSHYVYRTPITTAYKMTRRQALSRACLIAVFTILFFLSFLRVEVGNDYKNYAITCHEVWVNGYVVTEPGFNALVKIIYTIAGHENYILVFAVFAFVTIYLFLKTMYEDCVDFTGAFFLFMSLGYYFRTFNTVRYYLVLAVALFSMRYVNRGQYVRFFCWILAAALFHKSVLFVIPVYLTAVYVSKKWHYFIIMLAGGAVLALKEPIMGMMLKLYPSYEDTSYVEGTSGIIESLLNNAPALGQCILVLLLCLVCYKYIENKKTYRVYFNLNVFALVMYVCGYYFPLLSRFTYYMIISHILLVPGLVSEMEEGNKRKIIKWIVIGVGIVYFLLFLRTASVEGIRVLPYKTWIMDGMKEYLYYNEVS